MASYPSSYIRTNGGTAARAVDKVSWTFAARPQPLAVYLRFLETGSGVETGLTVYICQISRTNPLFRIGRTAGSAVYRVNHVDAAGTTAASAMAAGPSYGDLVELVAHLRADGSVRLFQSLNEGAVTAATASSALALPTAWGDTTLELGGNNGSNAGLTDLTTVLIVRGAPDLPTLRRRAGQ